MPALQLLIVADFFRLATPCPSILVLDPSIPNIFIIFAIRYLTFKTQVLMVLSGLPVIPMGIVVVILYPIATNVV